MDEMEEIVLEFGVWACPAVLAERKIVAPILLIDALAVGADVGRADDHSQESRLRCAAIELQELELGVHGPFLQARPLLRGGVTRKERR